METATRPMPWDVMGHQLSVKATTVSAALKEAGLDYTVRTAHAAATAWNNQRDDQPQQNFRHPLEAPGFQAIVRPMPDGTEKVLAFTKKRYTPIQNGAAFNVADYLVQEFGAKITGAADYRGGDRSLLVVGLPDTISLTRPDGGEDAVDLSLIVTNDHAGNAALTMALTPVRIACTNALPAAMANAERVWKISHTPKAQARIDLAAEAIKRALVYRDAFQAQAQAMMDQTMVDAEFRKMVARLYPVKKDAEGTAADNRRAIQADLLNLWAESPTLEGVRGTRWAGYNAVTEYLDHFRPVRGEESVARAEGALDGPYVRQKAKLWSMFAAA